MYGGSTSGTITIGSGSNNVDYPSGTTVDFTGATITGTSFLTAETISLTALKTEVAASADFADFQAKNSGTIMSTINMSIGKQNGK